MLRFASTRRLLKKLDGLYRSYSGSDTTVCGWLEESFDEIAHNCVRAKLRNVESRKLLIDKISRTNGFDYQQHAQPLLSHAIGVVRLIQIERDMERDGSLTKLKGMIGNLKPIRSDAAHTSIAGTTSTYPAPSIALQRFETCLPLMQKLWVLVK
jgi:hypothetical protein